MVMSKDQVIDGLNQLNSNYSMEIQAQNQVIGNLKMVLARFAISELPIPKFKFTRVQIFDNSYSIFNKYRPDLLYPVDLYVQTITLAELESFLEWDTTHTLTYVPELFDCDDYARTLQHHAHILGITAMARVVNTIHSFNVISTSDVGSVIIEPQTDSIVDVDNYLYKVAGSRIEW